MARTTRVAIPDAKDDALDDSGWQGRYLSPVGSVRCSYVKVQRIMVELCPGGALSRWSSVVPVLVLVVLNSGEAQSWWCFAW